MSKSGHCHPAGGGAIEVALRFRARECDRACSIRLPGVYYFLVAVVVRYETTATARRALLLIVGAFFNGTITVAIWTGFHVRLTGCYHAPRDYIR
jgi:hypothetical protein